MTLTQLEARLKEFDPRFNVKRYGTSMAAVHFGNEHLFRVPQGEVTLYNVTEERVGESQQYATPTNPRGLHKYDYKLRRGLGELAHLLYMGRRINSLQAARLRNGGKGNARPIRNTVRDSAGAEDD